MITIKRAKFIGNKNLFYKNKLKGAVLIGNFNVYLEDAPNKETASGLEDEDIIT